MRSFHFLALIALVASACDEIEQLANEPLPGSPHEAYAVALRKSGLHETALGREWLGAAHSALQSPLPVTLPIREAGYLAPEQPAAMAYRVNLLRGRRLSLHADLAPHPGALLFVDIFSVPEQSGDSLRHVMSADSGIRTLDFEPRRSGDYIIRIQPELLRGGRYTLTLKAHPALAFPVQGRGNSAILSGFGAPRDGGARNHHGIDIFAPRGTPVIAPAPGVVNRVRETGRGGRVVWVRDERRGINLYFAHLDQQLVSTGQQVNAGDTIGLVGNTGNARSTPPHLHFGVYSRGPQDPRPWVARVDTQTAAIRGSASLLGGWGRTQRRTTLRRGASASIDVGSETMVRVMAARADWYLVSLPDRSTGLLPVTDLAPAEALRSQVVVQPTALLATPSPNAAVIDTLKGQRVQVYGRFGDYLYVRGVAAAGWIPDHASTSDH